VMAKLVELIETDDLRGVGIPSDPCRRVQQWFTKDGTLVVESDPHAYVAAQDMLRQISGRDSVQFDGVGLTSLRSVLAAIVGEQQR
jgi:hypothetical protein